MLMVVNSVQTLNVVYIVEPVAYKLYKYTNVYICIDIYIHYIYIYIIYTYIHIYMYTL